MISNRLFVHTWRYYYIWRSTKQFIITTSSNHVQTIVIHEESRECCVSLRSVTHFIKERYDLKCNVKVTAVLFEDNTTCIAQLREGFIKGDRMKHISPKLFFTHDLQKNGDIDVRQICSSDNPVDLFTKSLSASTLEKMVHKIGLRKLNHLYRHFYQGSKIRTVLFFSLF